VTTGLDIGRPPGIAAAEQGVDLARLGLVPNPKPDWPRVVAALIEGTDLVVVASPAVSTGDQGRSLAAPARQHSTVWVAARPGWRASNETTCSIRPLGESLVPPYRVFQSAPPFVRYEGNRSFA
jgi:hypothetical protein